MKKIFCLLILFGYVVSISILSAQERAVAQKGEIVSGFLKRNNRPGKRYYKAFVELNKKRLGPDVVLKYGLTYRLPPLEGQEEVVEEEASGRRPSRSCIDEPLFGAALARVKVSSQRLKNACFYIVSGHGGPDPGAIGRMGEVELHEDEYAYDIAIRLARNLMEEGAEVHIIIQDAKDGIRDERYLTNSKRETCMGNPIPLNQVERLRQRCDKINALYRKDRKVYNYCRALFIHVDSRSEKQQTDVFFYHSARKAESKRLANTLKDTFESKYDKHQPNRGFTGTVSERSLFVLDHVTPAAAFVELGNIQNSFDQQRFVLSSNRQALAKWLCEGFLKDAKR